MMYIGITTRIIYEDNIKKQFVNEAYIEYVKLAGFTPIILPMLTNIDNILDLCDAFLITGGDDLHSKWYNEPLSPKAGTTHLEMDEVDKYVIEYAAKNKKPMIGICRGLQAINVFMGGSLIQHIEDDSHKKQDGDVEFNPVHNGSIFDRCYHEHSKINTYHHQCIKDLAPNFEICGYSNGCIEAIKHNELPIIAVQWHPERLMDEESINLIKEFSKMLK